MAAPTTRYAQSGELSIAYQCVGEGSVDILIVPGFVSNVELLWDLPAYAEIRDRLGAFGRLIVFDKRGTGCSDRSLGTGSAEDRMDDVRAVADAAGIDRAVVIGLSEGGPLAILFATTYPERVESLVLWGTFARCRWAQDYDIGRDDEIVDWFVGHVHDQWGTGEALEMFLGPIDRGDGRDFMARYERQSATPGVVATILQHNADIDVRHALGAVAVPTLVVHREGDPIVPLEQGRYLADHIAGARLAPIPGAFHLGDRTSSQEPVLDVITEFITGAPVTRPVDVDRVLMTVLFTDIVDSTAHAAAMGDKAWKALLEHHDDAAAAAVEKHRGVVVKRTGDGLLATFDGPGRAVRAACGLREAVRPLGLDVRAGLHTGEVERRPDDVAGIGVHIGARVSALAGPGEVLVTGTVKDLVFGSELEFEDRGSRTLKGVPGYWHLWAAV